MDSTCHVAAALHSQPLEVPLLREFIRIHLAGHALGTTGETAVNVRRPVDGVLI